MKKSWLVVVGMVGLIPPARVASPQELTLADTAFARLVVTVVAVDHLVRRCANERGIPPTDSAALAAWELANGVGWVRSRMAPLEYRPGQRQAFVSMRATLETGFRDDDPCAAAMRAIRLPAAGMASSVANLTARLAASPEEPTAVANGVAVRSPADQPPGIDQIESFGFHSRMSMGVGGFMTLSIYPVVLFKNGAALREITGLGFPGGLEAHRQRHPNVWTRWRRNADTLQIEIDHGWKKLHFQRTYRQLPDDFRLDGFFRMLTGTGTAAIGGTQSVSGWQDYRFFSDGRVLRGGGAGASVATGDGSVVASAIGPAQKGRYRVEGLLLRMSFEDGTELAPILVTDPTDPKSAIWLNGTGYARRSLPR